MKAKKKIATIVCCALVGALAIGGGVTAYAAENPESVLGQLIFSATAQPSDEAAYFAVDENGATRPMTSDEINTFTNNDAAQGSISPDGKIAMSAGSSTDMPLVIDEDGTVREMTQEEFDALGNSEYEEFSASATDEVIEGSFGK